MRQLAAIMFCDMAGYTAPMHHDEQLAKAKRIKFKTSLENSVSNYHGKILQYYGDGALSISNSAVDAVSIAIELQQSLLQDPKVDVRIGIHIGDISIDDETIYGDGVNMASRIESLAVPGSIFISEKVFDEIKNHQELPALEIGYFELKNIDRPVRVYAISNKGLIVPNRSDVKGKIQAPVGRLAVLPFVNMITDIENEYFSDGITEELLNALSRVNGLQVTSRTSAFAFKGKNLDVREIGAQLNVDRIIEGSVRKAGNKVRITAQLINAADGYHIWSENYDRSLNDIFEVQDEIGKIIANRCRENLTLNDRQVKSTIASIQNVDAYTLFLKGLHYHNKLTPADSKKAIEYFEKAIDLEPAYALAYAMAANSYALLGTTGQLLPSKAFELVHQYAEKALQLDENCAAFSF